MVRITLTNSTMRNTTNPGTCVEFKTERYWVTQTASPVAGVNFKRSTLLDIVKVGKLLDISNT